jgi:hypothetical protein
MGASIDIDVALSLATSLRVNTRLRVLRFRNCPFIGSGASMIFDAIKENTMLEELYLERNEICEYSIKSFSAMIRGIRSSRCCISVKIL